MIPQLEMRYSYIYDNGYRNSPSIKKYLKKINKSYPSREQIMIFIKKLNKEWKKHNIKILKSIEKTTDLKWREKKIICYVIGAGRAISDPLTIGVYKKTDKTIDVLTHELIHQIQIQTENKKWNKWWNYLRKKYKKESITTKAHIFLSAVHKEIYLDLFSNKRLQRDIKECNKFPDYKRAWDIVEKEGNKNIIKKFKEITA